MRKNLRLVKSLISLILLSTLVLLLVRYCSGEDAETEKQIENTPMHIEQIKAIAHLATICFEDEVVVDSVEYYRNTNEKMAGNISKLLDGKDFKHGLRGSGVKRRMTLVISGKLRYGFDLQDPRFKVIQKDSIWEVHLPEPMIMDVSTTPSSTRVFQENGTWNDYEVNTLKKAARKKIIRHFQSLQLRSRACLQMETLIKPLLPEKKQVRFIYMQS